MGRYYSGDINGKFWFAVQPSHAADRFGVTGHEPNYLEYYFSDYELHHVEDEIKRIEDKLGDKLAVIDKFFTDNSSYNEEMLTNAGISDGEVSEYADLQLGIKIRDCIKERGYCEFTAEL
jgi:hypothetical protein